MKITVAGENSLIIYFADATSPEVSAKVQAAVVKIQQSMPELLIDMVPSYASLLVIYDMFKSDHFEVMSRLNKALSDLDNAAAQEGKVVSLPVYYSTESGPDLEDMARRADLSTDEIIRIHQQGEYRVYAIGFAPGFAYLGEVDPVIAAPRLAKPRLKVPRGAVAIADRQTAVYPAESPGGWNLIGLCPQRMFDPEATPSMPVSVGDRVRFEAVNRADFLSMGGEL